MKTTVLTTLIVALGIAASAHAQPPDTRASEAAARGLITLHDIVNETNHRTLGFDSVDEVRSAKLGDALPVFMVRLDQLKQYKNEEAGRLLLDLQTFVYPVRVAGQVRTTVEVRALDGKWETARMGGAQRIRALDKHLTTAMKATRMAPSDFFEVRIPALKLTFLGHHDGEGLKLTPLIDEASLNLTAGTTEPAEKVLARLVPLARATPENTP